MTAPALVLLAQGTSSPVTAEALHALRKQMQQARPELNVNLAFLDQCPPSGPAVVQALVGRGVREVVFVPLDLSRAVDADDECNRLVERLRDAHPGVAFAMARPIGPATDLLNILDDRVREALRRTHAIEVDALVLSTEGHGDARGNALLSRRARQWASHHKLPCQVAVGDGSGQGVAQAVAALRSQGRRHIVVGSFAIAPDARFQQQREAALAAGALAVSEPLAGHAILLDLVMARYVFAAMELLDVVTPEAEPERVVEVVEDDSPIAALLNPAPLAEAL